MHFYKFDLKFISSLEVNRRIGLKFLYCIYSNVQQVCPIPLKKTICQSVRILNDKIIRYTE
jgi:hypothetical protein